MRLLSGGAQFPEGTWSEARVYCGHDTGPAAAGCSRHERGGDSNQAFYWCDNNGPVSVSCTCGGDDGDAWKRVPLAPFVPTDDLMVGVLGSSGEVFFKGGLERGNGFRLAAIAVQVVAPHAGSYEVALTDRPGSEEFSAADDSLCKHSKITNRDNTDSFFLCTSDPRSAPYSQSPNSFKEVCKAYQCCGKSTPFELAAGANTLWLAVREMCSLASHLTITAVHPPSALPPSSSPRQCDMTGDNGIAAPAACADTSNGAMDSHGSTCADYVSDTSWCGNYDNDGFTAKFMCCACDGGTMPFSAASRAGQPVSKTCATYEAEDATLDPDGGMKVDDRHAGFTGTGVVDYKAKEGEYIEWTKAVNCDAAAGCDVSVSWRYALKGGNRDLDLNVNGRTVQTVLFPASGSKWDDYTSTKEISIRLEPGSNAIRLTSIGRSGANVDSMLVCKALGAFDCPLDGYEYRASTRGCQCDSATNQPLSTGEVCTAAGQPLGVIATAHEVLGEGACKTGDFACIDQGRRACDYVRLHGYKGSIDCFAFSLGKAGDKGGVQLLSSGASFRGDSVAPVVAPLMARIETMGLGLFIARLTSLERLTFERLGFMVPANNLVPTSSSSDHAPFASVC